MIVGTAGHIDHGKTSLIRSLTGVEADRLKEEKERGISIDLGFAYLPTTDGRIIGFVDVPGHERFVRNMLAGATGIDFVLLVIAADDGIMPQTREHLSIIDLLGIERGLVALTKSDMAGAGRIEAVSCEIADLLAPTSLNGVEIVPVSSMTGHGVDLVRQKLFAAAGTQQARADKGLFRLAVDRSFTLRGAGTVVTGTILTGQVGVDDHVLISPTGLRARVRSIHVQNQATSRGQAGDRCALNLVGDKIAKDVISRGDMIVAPDLHAPTDRIDAELHILGSETKTVSQWMPVRLHHAASETGARIVLLQDAPITPGKTAFVQLVLEQPVAAAVGDRFVLRDTSATRTIGGGRFVDLRAPARRRRTPERLAQLTASAIADPEDALLALLERPFSYANLTAFARDRTITQAELDAVVERHGLVCVTCEKAILVWSHESWERFNETVISTLKTFHARSPDLAGAPPEKIRLQLEERLPVSVFAAMIQHLQQQGVVAVDAALIKLPYHSMRLSSRDDVLWNRIRPLLGGSERFKPPRVRDIADTLREKEGAIRRLLKLLARTARVDEIAADHFFLRSAVADMVDVAAELAAVSPDNLFSAAQFRDRLGNGRKTAIQVLEFFDRHGVTMVRGDQRMFNKQRLHRFGRPADEAAGSRSVSGGEASPVGRPDFKSGKGRETVLSGFDSHSLPPSSDGTAGARKTSARPILKLPRARY